MKLLCEWFPLEYEPSLIAEQRAAGKSVVLNGVVQRADTMNQNGRIYPRSLLLREVENYQKLIKENRSVGECDHPTEPIVSLKNVSHVMRELRVDGNDVFGKIELLPTPSGKILEALVLSGIKIGISSRGVGSTKKEGNADVVQEDYQIVCWDCVQDPSTPGALLKNVVESVDPRVVSSLLSKNDKIDRMLNEIFALGKKE